MVPVKGLDSAKTRLAEFLSPEERIWLVEHMLRGVLGVIASSVPAPNRWMVTPDPKAMAIAAEFGFTVLPELRQATESYSVDAACLYMETQGVEGVLRVPLDLPMLDIPSFRDLCAAIPRYRTPTSVAPYSLLVPSHDRNGTNALYRSPPLWYASRFGNDSLNKHRDEVRKAGGAVKLYPQEGFALDIDAPEDLAKLLELDIQGTLRTWLESQDIPRRLQEAGYMGGPHAPKADKTSSVTARLRAAYADPEPAPHHDAEEAPGDDTTEGNPQEEAGPDAAKQPEETDATTTGQQEAPPEARAGRPASRAEQIRAARQEAADVDKSANGSATPEPEAAVEQVIEAEDAPDVVWPEER